MINLNPEFFIPIILYAETHYKFKGIYSRLYKKEPEIIADAPFRVEPEQPVPILLLVKDGHRFPIIFDSVTIKLKTRTGEIFSKNYPINITIENQKYWHRIIYFEPQKDLRGLVQFDVEFKINVAGKIKIYRNDNYRISSHRPLDVLLADEPLPRFENWYYGDFHYHSSYTEDQVEFGAPLEATAQMAQAIGLNFFAVTDHSYDLDDREDSFVENDPNIPKWFKMWEEVDRLNANLKNFVVLPGEEVSAGNCKNRNVHLLIINNKHFFHGKGDSAEQWLKMKPGLSIDQILEKLNHQAIAIAGHPEMKVPFLQWLLIRRGKWQWQDYLFSRLEGFQVWNGELDETFLNGTGTWIKLLLAGKKLNLIAGNDAHGNFNRFRQVGFPFFTFRELSSQIFGNMRTGVKAGNKFNQSNLIDEVKNRHVLVTNGPIVEFLLKNENGDLANIGDEIQGKQFDLVIKAKSTSEFGKIKFIKLFTGDLTKKEEIEYQIIKQFETTYFFKFNRQLSRLPKNAYLRLEVVAEKKNGELTKCLTNPVWIKR